MKYSLSNFKIFSGSEPHIFELAPITMLIGENNSGKSTITKSLLLFQNFFDTIRKDFINGYFRNWEDYYLDFTLGDHKLGSYENIIPFGDTEGEFKVGYSTESKILEYGTSSNHIYDIEITFTKNIQDSTTQLCLKAIIKEVIIRVDGIEFYSYKNGNEKIDLTTIRIQYAEVLKNIYIQPQRRERIRKSTSLEHWVHQNPSLPLWKYQRLLDRFIIGGRILYGDAKKEYASIQPNSIFPFELLSKVCSLNADEFERYVEDVIYSDIDKLSLNAALVTTAKAHLKWLVADFKKSNIDTFGMYFKKLEDAYITELRHLIVDNVGEPNSLLFQPWSDVVQKSVKEAQKDLNESSQFEYVLSILSLPGNDDYTKHFHLQCLRNFLLLIIGEAFMQNDKLVDFVHLGLDRAGMQRLYTFKSQGNGFNRILANYMQQQQNIHFNTETTFSKGDFLRKWLQKMTKFDNIEFQYAAEGEGVYISLKEKNNKQTLADVGYGMTPLVAVMIQIELAILQLGVGSRRDNLKQKQDRLITIIIEEPESNLHPNYQAQLADLFVDAYKEYGIEFILETHSEYLARRMQVIVKNKGIEKENIIIHNLKDGQDREIRIKEDGGLSQRFWPGFYSEALDLALTLRKNE